MKEEKMISSTVSEPSDDVYDEHNPLQVSSEASFFAESAEVHLLIENLSVKCTETSLDKSMENEDETVLCGEQALARLRAIFDKYLECSTLLDPHLEKICTTLCSKARVIIHDIYDEVRSLQANAQKGDSEDGAAVPIAAKTDHSQKIQNLKPYLSAIYSLSKVRGKKYIQNYLSHDAFDVEPILYVLRVVEHTKESPEEMMGEAHLWESIYSLLVWLGMLSLVPFDLNTMDSSICSFAKEDNEKKTESEVTALPSATTSTPTLIASMLATTRAHLGDSGPTREVAASSLASLLSRPDLEERELKDFVTWANSVLEQYLGSKDGSASSTTSPSTIFLVMGVVKTLASIFKTGSRSNLMDRHLRFVALLWERAIIVAERASPDQKTGSGGGALLLRKLLVKLFARVGCAYLPPRVAHWRYQRGRRSLLENLNSTAPNVPSSGPIASSRHESITGKIGGPDEEDETEENIFNVPDEVEDSMAQLIRCLVDPSTAVRWSCAKGVGRVTERLPSICADDVLDAILELCNDEENDNAWHGSCLALAELARRGLLLPRRLGEVVPIIVRALQFDVPRGRHSVGSNVRDAACYCCWAFARAYAPSILEPFIPQLSKSIVLASLFDREVNCRRAASASFQECVGRQGADNFKHGIAILTVADYFSLGNRTDSFTNVAHQIAQFEEYCRPIIDHLYEVKLFHWDIEIRILASRSLRGLTSRDPAYFANTVLPELIRHCLDNHIFVRHGAILGVAEVVLGLGSISDERMHDGDTTKFFISDNDSTQIADLVPAIEKARLYRGRGGEIVRSAVSRLIECLSKSKISLTVKQQLHLLDSLDENLKHPNEDIQISAATALASLMETYFPVGCNGPSERLQKRVVDKYVEIVSKEDNPAATRGFTLALGHLPAKLLAPTSDVLDSVINCLKDAAHHQSLVGGEGDAETRRNAIQSLVRVCHTVGIGIKSCHEEGEVSYPRVCLDQKQVKIIFIALLDGVEDYKTDRRGDIGSWSRIAAMNGLESLTYLSVNASNCIPQNPSFLFGTNEAKGLHNASYVPSFKERLLSLEQDASSRVSNCLKTNQPLRVETIDKVSSLDSKFFDDQLCAKVIGAILKQLSEKLDAVRNQAGSCVERLLLSTTPSVPFISCRDILLEALSLDSRSKSTDSCKKAINWANPASTFPLIMKAINIDTFFFDIVSGLVISVGGLTESVTKHSSKYLLDYLRALQKLGSTRPIVKLGHAFIRLFEEHTREGRVILPLLTTLDKLLSCGCLDFLLQEPKLDFPEQLLIRLQKEASGCTDMKRLMAIVPVAIGLLHAKDTDLAHGKVLTFLMRLLGHRYPRIRCLTAEQMYVKLLEDDSVVPNSGNLEAATDLLSQVRWDQQLGNPGDVRESRNQVSDFLGAHLSDKDRTGPAIKKKSARVVDEFESYASLVQSEGR